MNIEKYKTALLNLKNEYQSRIDKISDHIYHPQDDLNHHWTDQAVASQENDMRKNLLFEAEQSMTMVNNALYASKMAVMVSVLNVVKRLNRGAWMPYHMLGFV